MTKYPIIKLSDVIKQKTRLSVVPLGKYFALATMDSKYAAEQVNNRWYVITFDSESEAVKRLAEIKKEMK